MPADKCIELLECKLETFGLSLSKDIVGICTDGTSVMVKVGRLLEAEQQLCYAHGIQLAVLDVLYKHKYNDHMNTATTDNENDEITYGNNVEVQMLDEDQIDLEQNEDEDMEEGRCGELQIEDDTDFDIPELSDQYKEVIDKVRKVVKIFRKSPTKNDAILQKYVVEGHGKELNLMLDCPTRWNSLLAMLGRFNKLASSVQKSLIDLKLPNEMTDADYLVVQEIVSALEPITLTVEAICRRDISLIAAEAAIKFCIVDLGKKTSELAKTMAVSLESRMRERRLVPYIQVFFTTFTIVRKHRC